ncbi:MAG: hypothetical protein U9N59_04850 [Campylobacterota bacterium]|nr:hypothetical protein [Campylobacterota bacterium]
MAKCTVCNSNSLNNKNLNDERNKCILHCKKTDKNNWYTLENNVKKWNQRKLRAFWKYYTLQNDSDTTRWESIIPPLPNCGYQTNIPIVIEHSTILDDFKLVKYESLSILASTVKGDITVYNSNDNSARLFFSETIHDGNITVIRGNNKDINLNNIKVNHLKLGREDKDDFPNNYQSIKITGDNTHIKNFDICNTHIHNTFIMNNIKIDKFNCINAVFNKEVTINKCNSNSFLFTNNTMQGISEFDDNILNEVDFIGNKFNNVTSFEETVFDKFSFSKNSFDKLAIFKNANFKQKLNLETNTFKDEVNFLKATIMVKNRETARIIKHSFEKINNIIEANRFYALEMEKQEEELKWNKNFAEKLVFTFHKLSSNHSQDWVLVLLWILNITILMSHWKFFVIDEKSEYFIIPFILNIILTVSIGFNSRKICKIMWSFMSYLIYILITNDYILCFFANTINPFSIMTGAESLTFTILIYKITIAYLIYQLIISIRQNTRRN